ncbi:MAG: hypothetical protein ACLP5H_19660 [Desulfomonilaceae bacterium]
MAELETAGAAVPKLQILALHPIRAAQRFFGTPDFRYYALTGGIKAILSKSSQGILAKNNPGS